MKYRKKPVVIDAVQFNGRNVGEIEVFIGNKLKTRIFSDAAYEAGVAAPLFEIDIETLEGVMTALPNDYIIKGVKGEFYPCKPDVFEQTYENAEGEEMLTVTRSQIQKLYSSTKKVNDPSSKDYINGVLNTLDTLFGSKCLPDETVSDCYQLTEPKLAEPKYHIGEEVRYNGYVYEVEGLVGKNRYALKGLNFDLDEDMIDPYEPYTEPEKESRSLSQNIVDCDKMVDNILKDSFRNGRRLTIAAMAMQGMLSNTTRFSSYEISDLVRISLNCADALITESEEGGMKC